MKISKIKVPTADTKKVNLKEINLTRKPLGSVVALVGKNGAGKSRILNFVEGYVKRFDTEQYFEDHISNIPTSIIQSHTANLVHAKKIYEQLKKTGNNIQQIKAQTNTSTSAFFSRFRQLAPAYIKVVDNDDLKQIKANINNNLTFEYILNNGHFDSLIANPNGGSNSSILNEFTALNNNLTINYFAKLTNEIVAEEFNLYLKNRNNPIVIQEEIKKNRSYQLFENFQKYVKQFLGKEFSYVYVHTAEGNKVNSTLHLNNEPFDINLLSPGQKMLFAYAILFFYLDTNSKTNIRESIIIIDEPEKHLHPEAQIKLIDALKDIIGKTGQLWIATHSVHILSHLDFDEILMIKDDEIIPPSRTTPGNSFVELMGLENHILELSSFINSVSEWAYSNFMVQCFKNPEVIFEKNVNDPQFKLFKEFIENQSNIKLIDFGAGKGRIGYTIAEDESISKKVLYSAFEPDKTHNEILNKIPNIQTLFNNPDEIPPETYDIVILCNVLHEIHPNEWTKSLNLIKTTLKEDGYLIIVEDRFLPKGETAHEYGYIILGHEETALLLNSNEQLILKPEDNQFSDRIIFSAFKKNEINPSKESLKKALSKLETNTFENIKILKKDTKDVNQGRRLANETQLYINAQMFLSILNSKK